MDLGYWQWGKGVYQSFFFLIYLFFYFFIKSLKTFICLFLYFDSWGSGVDQIAQKLPATSLNDLKLTLPAA